MARVLICYYFTLCLHKPSHLFFVFPYVSFSLPRCFGVSEIRKKKNKELAASEEIVQQTGLTKVDLIPN